MSARLSAGSYEASIRAAWAARDERLRDPHGWLSLAGLWWLHPGPNSFGADASNEIVVRGDGVPPLAGVLDVGTDGIRLHRADPRVLADGAPAGDALLRDDVAREPTMLAVGALRMHLIRRGERMGLRVRNPGSRTLAQFRGMDHYPIDPGWRVTGRVERAPGEEIEIVDVTGDVSHQPVVGILEFERDGRTSRLVALEGDAEGRLWLIFGDATNGNGTYGGGRYLVTEPMAVDGSVVADFNLAYNPPCVFSSFATCPLPPAANRLPIAIEAGERAFEPG